MKLDRILVPTDLSPESLRPLQEAASLGQKVGGELTLLYIVPDLELRPHGAPLAPPLHDPNVAQRVQEAKTELLNIASDLPGVQVDAVAGTDAARTIVQYAADHDFDLIALSTHGRTGWRRLALGSVAEVIVRESPVPVLTFHRPEKK